MVSGLGFRVKRFGVCFCFRVSGLYRIPVSCGLRVGVGFLFIFFFFFFGGGVQVYIFVRVWV